MIFTSELMPVIMATGMMRMVSWRKLSGPWRRRCGQSSVEGVVEDRVYQEGGQVDGQEWGGHCH
jgi:hypothetical protein